MASSKAVEVAGIVQDNAFLVKDGRERQRWGRGQAVQFVMGIENQVITLDEIE